MYSADNYIILVLGLIGDIFAKLSVEKISLVTQKNESTM